MKQPAISLLLAGGLLVAVAVPFLDVNIGFIDVASFPDKFESKKGFLIIKQEFPDLLTNRARVVIDGPMDVTGVQDAIASLRTRMEADPNIGVTQLEINGDRDLAVVSAAIKGGDASSEVAISAVKRLRGDHIPATFGSVPSAEVLVGGETAFYIDFFRVARNYAPLVFAFVLGVSFLLLTVVFRSIVVCLKSIILNLLSVGAAYGLLVLVFQKGVGNELLGFQKVDGIEAWLPLFLFAILFGLSMDYHVFLMNRIRERYDQTRDNAGSVAFGIRTTGRLITGAALIMVAVFGGFAFGASTGDLQQFGFGLGVAVLLDATIVRMVLVPAAMQLLGDWNWYLPGWLRWLPDLRIEAEQAQAEAASD
jgi:RND superfamily putative drug exporter